MFKNPTIYSTQASFYPSLAFSMFLIRTYAPRSLLSRCVCHSQASLLHTQSAQLNSNRTSVVRSGRQVYERSFPVLLLRPDGSTVHVRYKEPRRILVMPVDVSTLSEEERRARQKRDVRRTTHKLPTVDFRDDFRADKYSHFWKRK